MFKEINILKLFFENPTRRFSVREMARKIKISPATASKKLKYLARKGILKKEEIKNIKYFYANLDSELYRDMKVFYNIRKIKDSGLIEELNRFYLKPTIVLFGSAAFGLDTEKSDIDLLVISERVERFDKAEKYEKKINRKLQIFVVKKLKELRNKHLINNILNGIVLQGEIKWI